MGAALCRPDWLLLRLLEFFFFLNLSFVVKGYVKASEATQMGSPKWNWFDPELSLKYFSYALQPYAKNNFLCCKGNVFKLQTLWRKAGPRGVVSSCAPLRCWKGVWCNWKGGRRRQPRGSYLSSLVPCVEVEGNGHSETLQGVASRWGSTQHLTCRQRILPLTARQMPKLCLLMDETGPANTLIGNAKIQIYLFFFPP